VTPPLAPLVDAFTGLDAVVLGDAVLDSWVEGAVPRLAREAPVPVLAVTRRREAPGAAANAARNLAALGARAALLSVVGDDAEGARLLALLADAGVDVSGVLRSPARRTVVKQRLLADGHILARVDDGTTAPLGPGEARALGERACAVVPGAGAVLVSDYGGGVLGDGLVGALAAGPPRAGVLVVDAKDPRRHRALAPTAVTPSFEEARLAAGAPVGSAEDARAAWVCASADALLDATGARAAVVTLDRDGAVAVERGSGPHRTWAVPAPESACSGAGDTFAAALALALAAGADTAAASDVAAAAASVVVARESTDPCTGEELRARLVPSPRVLSGAEELGAWGRAQRAHGRRVVFTNGCFDLIHPGHVALLRGARQLGDRLVVAINADASVRRLKGPGRPLNTLEDRMKVLAAMDCVDHVVPFEEDGPEGLIEALRPDVVAKGGDYTRATLPEAPLVEALGGEVRILDGVPERSTSGLIARAGRRSAP
jgi:D-beta-D-heptose 7-phosphate kinase/D-beta-D-heptose 1-phosphate adenosyltransferase